MKNFDDFLKDFKDNPIYCLIKLNKSYKEYSKEDLLKIDNFLRKIATLSHEIMKKTQPENGLNQEEISALLNALSTDNGNPNIKVLSQKETDNLLKKTLSGEYDEYFFDNVEK